MAFVKASKKKQKARLALIGPGGSGKTYTALLIAKSLGSRVAVIDTERGSASKYAGDVADFDVCEPADFAPDSYVDALRDAARAGFDVIIIDSLSHAWEGEGGILEQVDKRGGRFDAWKEMAPQTRRLIEAILTYPGHVIATLRTKTEWVVEQVKGRDGREKATPRKIGLAPKFKEGLEYEFDVVALMDDSHVMTVTKTRCAALDGAVIAKPGADVAKVLREWLDDGEDRPASVAPVADATERHAPAYDPTDAHAMIDVLADCNATTIEACADRAGKVMKGAPADLVAKVREAFRAARGRVAAAESDGAA